VKKDITVVLQGDGGDELLAGYSRYDLLNSIQKWKLITLRAKMLLPNAVGRKRAKRVYNALSQSEDFMKLALLTTAFKNEDFELFNSDISSKLHQADLFISYRQVEGKYKNEPIVQRMLYTDVEIELPHTFLDKVDKSTMLNSMEARVPFLDNELASFALSVPVRYKAHKGEKKYLLRSALRNVVPDEIIDDPKRGFEVPIEIWLCVNMVSYTREKLTGRIGKELFNQAKIKGILMEHLKQDGDRSHMIWKLLVLVIWVERYEAKIRFNTPNR
jgi:asparagine synthase (glutamine-hydrolysing)